ncbi:MAG TPA: type I DNA topoisomerase [bacterium]|nr:type I DNA topoisomerase [bacterium]
MSGSLVIVESPAKASTLKKYLGKNFNVLASVGHVIDLPMRELGVDVENGFEPNYVIIRGKSKILKKITDAAKKADAVYLAPDPDREGEAIAWHIADRIRKSSKSKTPPIYRVKFNEITKDAVKNAIASPGDLDKNLFDAQQARRILDRLVGYRISPLLWEKVRRGLSAGRVQSVAVRIVCEREQEIDAFKAKEYWSIVTRLKGGVPPPFEAKLIKISGKDFEIAEESEAEKLVNAISKESFLLSTIKKSERRRRPAPPFITSKLQQEAARKLGFTAKKTMAMAQMLYEGVEIGSEGSVGLITYMRTDSIRVSDVAIEAVRKYIADKFGKDMLPAEPVIYKSKRGAQDAHEAIRPTLMTMPPELVKEHLDRDAYRLYDLIWKRFVASQMEPAVFDQTSFDIEAGKYLLRATGQVMKFAGFISVYMEGVDDEAEKGEEENPTLPNLSEGEKLELLGIEPHQHFTQPPPRFTEASLVKELEEKGIGRPSTYASILSTIQEKGYVRKLEKRFHPSELGKLVNELLVENFPKVIDVGFTAQMEGELDEVEEGRRDWKKALDNFYAPFESALSLARKNMRSVKGQQVETEILCDKCGSKMVIKWGRHGEFLACSKYPECRTTKEFSREENGELRLQKVEPTGEVCDLCGKPMLMKRGRYGQFLACSEYPKCKNTKSISSGVKCPKCGEGDLVQKSTKRSKIFYGCDKYPKCDYATWDKPIAKSCPECGSKILVERTSKKTGEVFILCPQKGCPYRKKME